MPLTVPDFLQQLLAKPVAILGGGVSGEGVGALLTALGAVGKIYDAREGRGEEFTPAAAKQHALVAFSPGFAPEHPWLNHARAAGLTCLGELDFASLFWRGRLVAITGTNGKTTLTEFLVHALGAVGRDAYATGNIGRPLSQLVAEKRGGARDMFAVCEVSSFQAETLQHFRCDATLWTNFAEDHLERHASLEAYFAAKWKLVERTDRRTDRARPATSANHARDHGPEGPDTVFIGTSVQHYAQKFDRPICAGIRTVDTGIQRTDTPLADTVFEHLPQRENYLIAAAWWHANGFDERALAAAARTFKLGRHRLARVAEIDGVTYWNDSKATNFHAVEAALARFTAPVILIAGGKAKGGDIAGFVHRIAPRVKHALLIGETAAELAFHGSAFRMAQTSCVTLAEAVRRAAEIAVAGDQVLLSPGFASFDMFRSYEDRGDQFESLVRNLRASATSLR